jgi:hypothetical protein
MSVRNSIVLSLALFTLALLVGCGSSSPKAVAPPSGGFSDSNLMGTYVFSSTGVDSTGGLFLTAVGSLAADGKGGINSGGTVDIVGASFAATSPVAQPITGGSYSVGVDGRGQIHFNTTTSGGAITITLDFVLTSSKHGLITEFDGNGTGSGTIDLQTSVSQNQLAGSYSFGFAGTGTDGLTPFATVGAFTLDSTGAVTTGQEDVNNAGGYSGAPSSILTTSTVHLGTTPGTATINSAGISYTFDVYPIDSTHLKFIETDLQLIVSGDAYTQGTSIPSGQLVFTMAGVETATGVSTPIDVGGYLTNSSGTITAGLEDYNDGGVANTDASTPGGGFSALSGGRSQLTLTGFVNGAANDLPGTYIFAAYPFTFSGGSGIQLLEIDNLGVTSGAAYPQTATSLAASQGYGLNLTGFNGVEEDDIAEFVSSSGGFTGIVDLNDGGTTLSFDKALTTSTYIAPDSNGRGGAATSYFGFNFYVVNSSTFILLETDSTQVGVGTFELQNASSAAPASALPAVALGHPAMSPHAALRRKQ